VKTSGIIENEKTTAAAANATGAWFLSLGLILAKIGVNTAPITGMSQQSHGAYGSNRHHVQKLVAVEMEVPTVIWKIIAVHCLYFYIDLEISMGINIRTI